MPYSVVKRKDNWVIINEDRNETVGHSDSKENAQASVRARLAKEHGVKFCNEDVEEFAKQYRISYVNSYRMFELNSAGLLTKQHVDKCNIKHA